MLCIQVMEVLEEPFLKGVDNEDKKDVKNEKNLFPMVRVSIQLGISHTYCQASGIHEILTL